MALRFTSYFHFAPANLRGSLFQLFQQTCGRIHFVLVNRNIATSGALHLVAIFQRNKHIDDVVRVVRGRLENEPLKNFLEWDLHVAHSC